MMSGAQRYEPLRGVKVLDIGILIPANQCTVKLAALGADVVKVEMPKIGDRIRYIGGVGPRMENGHHQTQARGKRSIALNLKDLSDREIFLDLAAEADVLVENFLPGALLQMGIDLEALRRQRPELIVCSITGFGQTGPLCGMPSHGLNMDALADSLNVDWRGGAPHLGRNFTSWGNEMGSTYACFAIASALFERTRSGEGAWIDISNWDTVVEAHRADIAVAYFTGDLERPDPAKLPKRGEFYNTYRSRDGRAVLLGSLEKKFWINFCRGVGREDLIERHTGKELEFEAAPGALPLRQELSAIFASADADEWDRRFMAWDCPGSTVLHITDVIQHPHFEARGLVQGAFGEWPNVANAIRWHHTGERAGVDMNPAPAIDEHRDDVLREWLGRKG
jgi:crotonobetainyl-CoA:carnitine CoA-transferase CaiB-like acyl-CoA transferase